MLFNDLDSCIAKLEANGYIILEPIESEIKTFKELPKYFFAKIKSRYNISPVEFNWRLEALYARTFVKQLSSKSSHVDNIALQQAKLIIDALMYNIDTIDKYFKLTTLKLLIMESTSWLLEIAMKSIKDNSRMGFDIAEFEAMQAAYGLYLDKQQIDNTLLQNLNQL